MTNPVLRKMGDEVYAHYCPGCKALHSVRIGGDWPGLKWWFDGDMRHPTFAPSLNWTQSPVKINGVRTHIVCHYNVIRGDIQYASDCGHEFSGTRVPLPPIPDSHMGVDDDIL